MSSDHDTPGVNGFGVSLGDLPKGGIPKLPTYMSLPGKNAPLPALDRSIRVLHAGDIPAFWLSGLQKHVDPKKIIIDVAESSSLAAFMNAIKQGAYDIVHIHAGVSGAAYLRAAAKARIGGRILHVHHAEKSGGFWDGIKRGAARWYATSGLASTPQAAAAAFGAEWFTDGRWRVMPRGFDMEDFNAENDPDLRARLGIAKCAPFIGVYETAVLQEISFLAEIYKCVHEKKPDAHFAMVGSQRQAIQDDSTLPSHLKAMDLFLAVGVSEGGATAVAAAQAAGLPCLLPETFPDEAHLVEGAVKVMQDGTRAQDWANAIIAILSHARPDAALAREIVGKSEFTLAHNARRITDLYQSQIENFMDAGLLRSAE